MIINRDTFALISAHRFTDAHAQVQAINPAASPEAVADTIAELIDMAGIDCPA